MKKIIIALLVVLALVSFVSCGKKAETTATSTAAPAPAETKAEVKAPETPKAVEEPAKVEEVKVETPLAKAEPVKSYSGKYKLGMGVVYSDSSTAEQSP